MQAEPGWRTGVKLPTVAEFSDFFYPILHRRPGAVGLFNQHGPGRAYILTPSARLPHPRADAHGAKGYIALVGLNDTATPGLRSLHVQLEVPDVSSEAGRVALEFVSRFCTGYSVTDRPSGGVWGLQVGPRNASWRRFRRLVRDRISLDPTRHEAETLADEAVLALRTQLSQLELMARS